MRHWPARLVKVLTYAALACGASFACLLLFASPAHADDREAPPLGLHEDVSSQAEDATGSVGRIVGEVGRPSADGATELVRGAVAVVPPAEPVVDATTRVVERTTDVVTAQVEHVAEQVDAGVGQVAGAAPIEPPGEPPQVGEPPAAEPAVEAPTEQTAVEDRSAGPGKHGADRDAVRGEDRERRAEAPRRTADRERSTPLSAVPTTEAAPLEWIVTTPEVSAPAAGAVEDEAPWKLATGCGDCATGSSGSSVDGPVLLALVGPGLLLAPGSSLTDIDGAGLGPAATFSRPAVSPD
ncbi:MAG TPA: hypothetical protein VD814_08070 [Nocardioides sp.]|nr:hypothetical protein [Nocardioides sp.]